MALAIAMLNLLLLVAPLGKSNVVVHYCPGIFGAGTLDYATKLLAATGENFSNIPMLLLWVGWSIYTQLKGSATTWTLVLS